MHTCRILLLPLELQTKILSHLELNTQIIARQVCRQWRPIIDYAPTVRKTRYTRDNGRIGGEIFQHEMPRIHKLLDTWDQHNDIGFNVDLGTGKIYRLVWRKWPEPQEERGLLKEVGISKLPFLDEPVLDPAARRLVSSPRPRQNTSTFEKDEMLSRSSGEFILTVHRTPNSDYSTDDWDWDVEDMLKERPEFRENCQGLPLMVLHSLTVREMIETLGVYMAKKAEKGCQLDGRLGCRQGGCRGCAFLPNWRGKKVLVNFEFAVEEVDQKGIWSVKALFNDLAFFW